MKFSDEFEYDVNGSTYYISVSGYMINIDGKIIPDLDFIQVYDEMGDLVEEDHTDYDDFLQAARDREYEVEIHSSDFDYYDVG